MQELERYQQALEAAVHQRVVNGLDGAIAGLTRLRDLLPRLSPALKGAVRAEAQSLTGRLVTLIGAVERHGLVDSQMIGDPAAVAALPS